MDKRKSVYDRNRLFNGPSDRKQFYIGSFLSKLSESDPENKYFTKSELIEIHSALRKEVLTNPLLFKLIQTIVDDGVFLDHFTLDTMKNGSEVIDYSENQIIEFQEMLNEQLEFKRLIQFNKTRMNEQRRMTETINDEPISVDQCQPIAKNNFETVIYCQNLNSEVNGIYEKLVGSKTDNRNLDNALQETITRLQTKLSDYNQSISKIFQRLKNDLSSELDTLLIKFLQKNCQEGKLSNNSNNHHDLIDLVEMSLPNIKQRYLSLNQTLNELSDLLKKFEENLKIYDAHRQMRNELNTIKSQMDQKIHHLMNNSSETTKKEKNANDVQDSFVDFYQEMMSFIRENQSKLNYDKIIESLQKVKAKVILLQHQLDPNYK